ncbi:DUF397 domain-containing protein [Actinomadura gamaensis]|uniref:DUF397 domain-containing protein n=1 Tax=Actinomadura gamaensis TaxID=1763541 RepID=A0ABV9UET8_9ACTN
MNFTSAKWRKSSRSQGGGTECVEVAELDELRVVRDSKNAAGPVLKMDAAAWRTFVARVKRGDYDA